MSNTGSTRAIRWVLLAVIGYSIALLTRTAYLSGTWVGMQRTRTDAVNHGAGCYDIRDGMRWHWWTEPGFTSPNSHKRSSQAGTRLMPFN